MFTNPGLTLGDQIFWIVDLVLKTLAPEACKLRIGAVSGVIWNRVRKFERQFLALYAQWKAGTLPQARGRKSTSPFTLSAMPRAFSHFVLGRRAAA